MFVGVGMGWESPWAMAGVAFALMGVGAALAFREARRPLLADALLVAGLVPLSMAQFASLDSDADSLAPWVLPFVSIGLTAALVFWRTGPGFVATFAAMAACIAIPAWATLAWEDLWEFLWTTFQTGLLAAIVVSSRRRLEARAIGPSLVATLGLLTSTVALYGWVVEGADSTGVEVFVGIVSLALLLLSAKAGWVGVALGAAIGLGLDAIVFAFDVGGALFGTLLLLGLGATLAIIGAKKPWADR